MKSLSKVLQEYLTLRRALGFKLKDDGRCLAQFVSFLEKKGASYVTTENAVCWAVKPQGAQPGHWARRLRIVRVFAEYLSAQDPRTEIPPKNLLPNRYRRKPPYIYTDEQVMRLIEAASRLPSTVPSTTGLRAQTYSTLLGLLSVTGMRIREALSLDRENVDLTQGILTVTGTKFGKSRLVPVHPSTQHALQQYGQFRDHIYPRPKTQSFFIDQRGRRLGYSGVLETFLRLSREIGLRGPRDSKGPRMHDFRHRFAVSTLMHWYETGADAKRQIQVLSTFLGHVEVSDTYWYLSAVPEFLQLVAARLERRKEDKDHEAIC
jgi:site-specific recombinase XerD